MSSPLAQGFASQVLQWAQGLGAEAASLSLLQEAAAAVSEATAQGHVCLWLDELMSAEHPAHTRAELLLASGVVAAPQAVGSQPLVLDSDGRLYLHRYFDYERRLARRLLRAAQAQRLTLISGGPGSGKTTAVLGWMAGLLERMPQARIALAAPTGKAAARMGEAIIQRSASLPAPVRAILPTQARTVHRLLGVRGPDSGFMHHAGRPLTIDALVVDEASMLDLALAVRLMEAVPEQAHIVLLGDPDQLASVEAGAVFGELCVSPKARDTTSVHPLAACLTRFTHSHRFAAESDIGRLAEHIRQGQADEATAVLQALPPHGRGDVRWLDSSGTGLHSAEQQALLSGFEQYLAAVLTGPHDVPRIMGAFDRFRVLCAVHEGPRGTRAVNTMVQARARDVLAPLASLTSGTSGPSGWYIGQPVMVQRNDPALQLYNGDIGIALPDPQGRLMVHFPDGQGGIRCLSPQRLPEYQTAFAMTVHKAQGSEFDDVMVLLPAQPGKVLTRELLYTAVTRSRQRLTLCGSSTVLRAAIAQPTRRHAGLAARFEDAVREGHWPAGSAADHTP